MERKIKYQNDLYLKISAMLEKKHDKKRMEYWDKYINITNRYNITAKEAFINLKQYYLTANKSYYNKHAQFIDEGLQLEIELRKLTLEAK